MAEDDLEALVSHVEALDDPVARARARALAGGILEMHREGLQALVEELRAQEGDERVRRLAENPAVGALLMLHDLHPVDPLTRVQDALRDAEGQLRGLGAQVVEVALALPFLRVRVQRDPQVPPGGGRAIREAVESLVLAVAPELPLRLEGADDQPGFIAAAQLTRKRDG